MWKSIFGPDGPQMKIWHMRVVYGYKHTFRKCNTYCFATVVVTRIRLNITLYVY